MWSMIVRYLRTRKGVSRRTYLYAWSCSTHFYRRPENKSAIQRTPHMPQSLFVTRHDIIEVSSDTSAIAVHIAVTSRAVNASCSQSAIECKEAFDIHMQVLANRILSRVPTAGPVHQ